MSMLFRRVRAKGFTLIDLLVVIAIIAILATILIPAISNALVRSAMTKTAKAGQSIFVTVYAKELDNVVIASSTVGFPKSEALARPGETSFKDSTTFFKYLVENKLLKVSYDFFGAKGVKPPEGTTKDSFLPANNAWCVVADLNDSSMDDTPFLFSRNLNFKKLDDNGSQTNLIEFLTDGMEPFGKRGFVFVNKGGSSFTLWSDVAQYKTFCPSPTNNAVLRPGESY